jgi:hypothetical protein
MPLQLTDFMASLPELGRAEQVLTQAKENAQFNIKWHRSHYQTVVQWLTDRGYTGKAETRGRGEM